MPVIGEGKKTSRYQYSLRSRTGLGGGGDKDFIQTPAIAVKLLLEVEKFEGAIWEPMCGRGAISKILVAAGFEVLSTDLVDRGFGTPGIDFFKCTDKAANLITNPPYSIFPEFITKAHSLYERKMALLLPLASLGGSQRRILALNAQPPVRIYCFTKRIPYVNYLDEEKLSAFPHMWVVWDKTLPKPRGFAPRLLWLRSYDKGELCRQ